MNTSRTRCQPWLDQLVDFADGMADPAVAQQVQSHLADCPACRNQLAALQISLQAAQSLWSSDARAVLQGSTGKRSTPLPSFPQPAWKAAAALALAAALLAVVLLVNLWTSPSDLARQQQNRAIASPGAPTDDAIAAVEVEKIIQKQQQIAMLTASSRLISTQEELRPYAAQTREILATHYGVELPPEGTRRQP